MSKEARKHTQSPWRIERNRRILEACAAGTPLIEIAKQFCLSYEAVRWVLKRESVKQEVT